MPLTGRKKRRILDIIFPSLGGLVFAVVGYIFTGYGEAYTETLGDAWSVFAAWLPITMIMMSILVAISNEKFILKTRPAKFIYYVIDIVMWSALFTLLTAIALFLFRSAQPIDNMLGLWTFAASFCAGFAIGYMWNMIRCFKHLVKVIIGTKPPVD